MTTPTIKTRRPSGKVPWPCILLEGEPKAGKSFAAAQLSGSDQVGTTYWIDLDEGAADEYGAIPGVRYQVVEHDGSYAAVLAAVKAVKAEAARAQAAGEPPVVLVIDTLSAVWDTLKDWANGRARKARVNQKRLAEDPNAEIVISQNLWNDAGSRWNALVLPLLTFPGIVVLIARGKEVVAIDDNGRPVEGKKEWRVEVRKNFEFSPTVWVRMQREAGATVIGARSVHVGIVPGKDKAKPVTDPKAKERLLEWLIFDALGVDPGTAHARDLRKFHAGELTAEEKAAPDGEKIQQHATPVSQRAASSRPASPAEDNETVARAAAAIAAAEDDAGLRELWEAANRRGLLQATVTTPDGKTTIGELIKTRHEQFTHTPAPEQPASPPTTAPAGDPLLVSSPDPDDPADCRPSAARRGVQASLMALNVTEERIAERFGRPANQVATKRLTALVKDVVARQQSGAPQ